MMMNLSSWIQIPKVGIEAQTQDITVGKGSDSSAWQGSRDMLYLETIIRPLPRCPELKDKTQPKQSTELDPNVDFEENLPYQEGIISETYINLDQTYFERSQELTDLVNNTKLVQNIYQDKWT